MGRGGAFGIFRGLDAFGKTMEDVKIKTQFGAWMTILSAVIILTFTTMEFVDYRTVHLKPSIVVDKSRGEKLELDLNITFPRVPCYLLSIDVMDISGEQVHDLTHEIMRTRLDEHGNLLASTKATELRGELAVVAGASGPQSADEGYCGNCYGGTSATGDGCCNSCEEVRQAYVRKGWSFTNPDGIEQCVKEGWSEKIKAQNKEGCNIAGHVHVNKVIGNLHLSPGKAFQSNARHIHDLVPYLKGSQHHDFGHILHYFRFHAEGEDPTNALTANAKRRLNIVDPLQNIMAHTEESNYMFQYFLKVVSTNFDFLDGTHVNSHQYSVTQYERNLDSSGAVKDPHGHQISHGYVGVPGVFFNYEISPLRVTYTETRQSFAHFLTSACAIIGGVLTVAGIIDAAVYGARQRLKGKAAVGGDSYAAREGKLL